MTRLDYLTTPTAIDQARSKARRAQRRARNLAAKQRGR